MDMITPTPPPLNSAIKETLTNSCFVEDDFGGNCPNRLSECFAREPSMCNVSGPATTCTYA